MNLRQRYKRAKQKIAFLEVQTVKPKYISATGKAIIPVATVVRVEPYEMECTEAVMQQVAKNLIAEAFKYARVEGNIEIESGKFAIRAKMSVIDERIMRDEG